MNNLWIILGVMCFFVIGFNLGRKSGYREGLEKGIERAPLDLKLRSLENGECVICGITKNFQDIAGKL